MLRSLNSLRIVSAILTLSGLIHLTIWLYTGDEWEGSLSLRKPLLFGLSAGMTTWSLSDVHRRVVSRVRDLWLVPATALALLLEVALITCQTWRREASHFNRTTPWNAVVDDVMFYAIVFVTMVVADFTFRPFNRLRADREMRLALRSGLVFLLVSCAIGFLISAVGTAQMARGQSPEVYGTRGALKFPHGVMLHAIQVLPLLVWLARQRGISPEKVRGLLWHANVGGTLLLAYALAQTFVGRGRWDMNVVTGCLLFVACVEWLVAFIIVMSVPGRTRLLDDNSNQPSRTTALSSTKSTCNDSAGRVRETGRTR